MGIFTGDILNYFKIIKDIDNLIDPNFRFLNPEEVNSLKFFKRYFSHLPLRFYDGRLKSGADFKKYIKDSNLLKFIDYFRIYPILRDCKMFFVIVPYSYNNPILTKKSSNLDSIAAIVDNLDDFEFSGDDELVYKNIILKFPKFKKNYISYRKRFFRENDDLVRAIQERRNRFRIRQVIFDEVLF
jgi:hypothetical protein